MSTVHKQIKGTLKRGWDSQPIAQVKREKLYSRDDVINAYLKGKKDQRDQEKKILYERFSDNLNSAKKLSVELFSLLKEQGIDCKFLSIKIDDIESFDVVFVVPEKNYISDEFIKIYDLFSDKVNEVNDDGFCYSFAFMPFTKKMDRNKMVSEGYILTYG